MHDLTLIEQAILSIPAEASIERLVEMRGAVDFAKQFVRELDKLIDDRLAEHLDRTGPQELGGTVWVLSRDKAVKPKLKPAEMAERLVQVVGGDWERFGGLLASAAFKHGACERACEEAGCPAAFDEMFETIYKQTPEGKPVKSVKKIPANIVK